MLHKDTRQLMIKRFNSSVPENLSGEVDRFKILISQVEKLDSIIQNRLEVQKEVPPEEIFEIAHSIAKQYTTKDAITYTSIILGAWEEFQDAT